jgi:quercetin dioxygenase-like cupin family protein
LYDQHRFYFVVQGSLAIHDPESGEVVLAGPGEAITWQGSRYHFGYNVGDDEVVVLDWFAPPDRPPGVPESVTMPAKRQVGKTRGGRYELLGEWPNRLPDDRRRATESGSMVSVGISNALHIIQGERPPTLVSILSSSEHLTAGTFALRGSAKTDREQHPGDEVVYCLSGRLHVHLPDSGQWFELHPLDCAFIPQGTTHSYWSYGADRSTAVFCVAPRYR